MIPQRADQKCCMQLRYKVGWEGRDCSFSREEGRKTAALQEDSVWNALYNHWESEGELKMAAYCSKQWNTQQPCWDCVVAVLTVLDFCFILLQEREGWGEGKAVMLGWVRGGLGCVCCYWKCLGLIQADLAVVVFRTLVGKRGSRMETSLLLQADSSPRQRTTYLVVVLSQTCLGFHPLPPGRKRRERNYVLWKITGGVNSPETHFLFAAGISISPWYALKTIQNKVFFNHSFWV